MRKSLAKFVAEQVVGVRRVDREHEIRESRLCLYPAHLDHPVRRLCSVEHSPSGRVEFTDNADSPIERRRKGERERRDVGSRAARVPSALK